MIGIVSGLLGIAWVPAVTGSTGPAEVSLRLMPGAGETRVRLTPLGTISADTHFAPASVELSLVEADIETLARAATSPQGRQELREVVTSDLRGLAVRGAIQTALGVALLAVAAAALLVGRGLWILVAAVTGSFLATGVLAVMIGSSFDIDAFEQPVYSGALVKAQQVIDVVARGEEVLDRARSRFDVASDRLSQLLVLLAKPDADPRTAGTLILHVSDIHANPIGFEITRQLADEFDVDAVLDTGDVASAELDTGAISTAIDPVDTAIAREIRRVGIPYLLVAGNHDSPQLRRRLADVANVQILDGSVATVESLRILGWADPTFSIIPIPEADKSRQRLEASAEVAERVRALDPDVVAVHDAVLGSASVGEVPLMLAGHTHERSEVLEGDTRILTVGSTGATGLKHLTFEAGRDYEAQILYFEDSTLVAVDYVSFEDIGGGFELNRRVY